MESDLDSVQALYQVIKEHVRIVTQTHVIGALRQQERILREKWRTRIIDTRDRLDRMVQEIIRKGVENGDFSVIDSRLSVLSTFGVLNDIIRWYSPQGRLSVEEIGECVADFILKGFGVGSDMIRTLQN